jgi:hypothetical protein
MFKRKKISLCLIKEFVSTIFSYKFKQGLEILIFFFEGFQRFEGTLDAGLFLENCLSLFGIVPYIFRCESLFEFVKAFEL